MTRSYTHEKIFGSYTPNKTRESIAEAEEKCKSYGFIPKASPSPSPSLTSSPIPSPSPSHSPSPHPPAGFPGRGRPAPSSPGWAAGGKSGLYGAGGSKRGSLTPPRPNDGSAILEVTCQRRQRRQRRERERIPLCPGGSPPCSGRLRSSTSKYCRALGKRCSEIYRMFIT